MKYLVLVLPLLLAGSLPVHAQSENCWTECIKYDQGRCVVWVRKCKRSIWD
jgi:hypothetical protein